MSVQPSIFGIPFSNCTEEQALDRLDELLQNAKKTGKASFAAFINAHCMNIAYHDKQYADILKEQADAVWPDGIGIKIAGKLLGFEVPANVNGTDLFPLICKRNYSIYMLGAAPGVAQKAMENASAEHSSARFVGASHGYFSDEYTVEDAIAQANVAKPDILLVALGVPRQEKWIAEHRDELHCGVAIAVGGLLDFISGRIPRAPAWMSNHGLEWCYRLYQEPLRLFNRYVIGNPLFIMRVLIERIKNSFAG